MFGTKGNIPKTIGTLVGSGTTIEGTLSYSGGLRVDGTVKGDIHCVDGEVGMVIISELGHVIGEVHAAHLVVSGKVTGPLYVTDVLELQPKAQVTGDVDYVDELAHRVGDLLLSWPAEVRPALKLATGGSTSDSA